jgi:hypothetical protein
MSDHLGEAQQWVMQAYTSDTQAAVSCLINAVHELINAVGKLEADCLTAEGSAMDHKEIR